MTYTFEDSTYVQYFLDHEIEPLETFTVIYQKQDGSQRQLTGHLEPSNKRLENVPVKTEEGWKSFNINRVLWIGKRVI